MKAGIVLLPGDGIGPDVVAAAVRVLTRVGERFGHTWTFTTKLIGGRALRAGQPALPDDTLRGREERRRDSARRRRRPGLRRPAAVRAARVGAAGHPPRAGRVRESAPGARRGRDSSDAGPLKPEVLAGTDLVVVRELTGGLYYGQPRGIDADGAGGGEHAALYTRRDRARRAGGVHACRIAPRPARLGRQGQRARSLAALADGGHRSRARVPGVTLTHELVDTAAMKLALAPASLRRRCSPKTCSATSSPMKPARSAARSGCCRRRASAQRPGLFEPVHGSAPDLAGRDIANPIGAIASAAMLLSDGLGLKEEGAAIIAAIERTLASGLRTADIADAGDTPIGTAAMAAAIAIANLGVLSRDSGSSRGEPR